MDLFASPRHPFLLRLGGPLIAFIILAGWFTIGPVRSRSEVTWRTYGDPSGIRVSLPDEWKISKNEDSGQIGFQGTGGQKLTVWPVFVPGGLNSRSAAAVLEKFIGSLGAGTAWNPPENLGTSAVRRRGRAGDLVLLSAVSWVPAPRGAAAWFYLASAPSSAYRQSEEVFANILSGLRLSGTASAAGPGPAYKRWVDPNEGAFSLEVPENWRTSGGLVRNSAVDLRVAWESVSPEGDVRVMGGDPSLPAFAEPAAMLQMAGFPEGSWYSPGYGTRLFVRRFQPGVVFVREYVQGRIGRACQELNLIDVRDRPDAVEAINRINAQFAMAVQIRLSAGEASFTCLDRGTPSRGYYFAGIQRVQAYGMPSGMWTAEYLFGYLAQEARRGLADSVLRHMLQSVQLNPQWVAMQQGLTRNTSLIVSQTQDEISRIVSDSYWSRQRVQDELSRRRSNAMLGLEDVVDPATGREIKVESGSDYYWIDARGTIVGTQTDTRPNLDFRELVRLP